MIKKRIVTGILGTIIMLGIVISPVNAASLSDQLAASNDRAAAAQYQIDMTQTTIDGIEAEITKANDEMSRISGVIDGINTEISTLEANIAQTQVELDAAEAKRAEQETAMDERVRTMYMYGNGSVMEFLFSSTSFSDFVSKVDMSRYIVEADKEALTALEETKQLIAEKKASIESDRLATVSKKAEQETQLAQQQQVKAQKDQLVAQNKAIIAQAQAALDAETADAANLKSQIAAEVAAANAANAANGSTTGGSASFVPSGNYTWPCGGEITSPFGPRTDPYTGYHEGVDIGASTGTPILAMGNASVISAGWNGGYGNCVVIDLGNGMQCYYGHMSQINVSAGQTVNRGDVLGLVGSTGNSTGPHCHFGILVGGDFVDPMGYF
ncbi:peptidoglycan DD-metalloendopeptidase family protein [Acetobacterium paludosum]|uniref:Peptidoglycan DD-metalloendopeptidase family protein n=1 Tax=Acetobacterium paludosum TaxID=52693 RepID=A0A923HU54_9FIRM|nr:M23 family metallopeptidase [Acetobacterium paludosum]MBC3888668.1 peptidoglycan DD-metalloendopeptidase family protein [Acetobacterium paludosum]